MVGSKDAGVASVMSFGISSSAYPTASLAAILAIGNPVALEARATERERRADDRWQPEQSLGEGALGLADAAHDQRPRDSHARSLHRGAECLPVLRSPDRLVVGADQLHAAAL